LVYSTSSVFDDFCSYTGPGQHNHIVDPGEQIQYDVTLSNTGDQAATGVTATLTTTTPGITISNGASNYADIAAGGTGTNTTHFVFLANMTVPCGTLINFNLHVTATGGWAWHIPFTVQVGSTSTLINENFEGLTVPALPAGWTTQVITGNAWLSFNSTTYSCSLPQAMRYPWNTSAAANSWVYTNGQALQAGVTYTLSFSERVGGSTFAEILGVYAGTAATDTGMTIQILPETTYTNTTCATITRTFTVPTTGTYYIGFHAASIADRFYLIVDDVRLTTTVCLPCECGIGLTPTTLPGGSVGDAYSQTVTANGGVTPFTYAVTADSLPPTLTLDPNTGAITGTLDAAGSYTFTITATDATGCTGSQQYTIGVALPFDMNFWDQYNRSVICFNSTTGEYQYMILTGAHSGEVYTGTAAVTPYGTTLYLFGSPCGSGATHCVSGSWNTTRHTASAILKVYTPARFTSSLSDPNYTDSPACPAN
jgi:hypothetical protein